MRNENDTNRNGSYSFTYVNSEDGRRIEYTFDARHDDDTIFWSEIHSRFLNFLSAVFGYDIRDQVSTTTVTSRLFEEFDESYGGNDE